MPKATKSKVQAAARARAGKAKQRAPASPEPPIDISSDSGADPEPSEADSELLLLHSSNDSDVELESETETDVEIVELEGEELVASLRRRVEREMAVLRRVSMYDEIAGKRLTAEEWAKGPERQRLGVKTGLAPRTKREHTQHRAEKDRAAAETSQSKQARSFTSFFGTTTPNNPPSVTRAPWVPAVNPVRKSKYGSLTVPTIPSIPPQRAPLPSWKPLDPAELQRLIRGPVPSIPHPELAPPAPSPKAAIVVEESNDSDDDNLDGYASDLPEDGEDLYSDDELANEWYDGDAPIAASAAANPLPSGSSQVECEAPQPPRKRQKLDVPARVQRQQKRDALRAARVEALTEVSKILDSKKQTMELRAVSFAVNHARCELRGKPKGMQQVLRERGLLRRGLVMKCPGKCGDRATDCCARRILDLQPDFKEQKSLVQEVIEAAGHICIFLPKYHCEINFIEYFWGAVKRYLREHCDYTFATLKENLPKAMASISVELIRKWEHRAWRFIDAYSQGLDAKDAQRQVKKFSSRKCKSHRRIPETLAAAMDA
ncbi:hypothetical protein MKEN_00764700 [Mycena kentingensis (nom. inval.)]|nr:hypothetical protein MKEN_00764700 [Mycena kentingensis (nom. inval.)]